MNDNIINRYFRSPYCNCDSTLLLENEKLICAKCGIKYRINNNIIEFVDASRLDEHKNNELIGNSFKIDDETINMFINKENWHKYASFWHDKKINILQKYIDKINIEKIAFLGCGSGFEINKIMNRNKSIKQIFASDLSYNSVYMVPYILDTNLKSNPDVNTILFTSDIDNCPISDIDIPIIIYEAIHHTPDIHLSIENLLKQKYNNILFVEPTNNIVIKWLAKKGLAQRIEYSGVKPGRLDNNILSELAKKYNYTIKCKTIIDIPIDYVHKFIKKDSTMEAFFCNFMLALSSILNLFKFGNFTIAHLQKKR